MSLAAQLDEGRSGPPLSEAREGVYRILQSGNLPKGDFADPKAAYSAAKTRAFKQYTVAFVPAGVPPRKSHVPGPMVFTRQQAHDYLVGHGLDPVHGSSRYGDGKRTGRIEDAPNDLHYVSIDDDRVVSESVMFFGEEMIAVDATAVAGSLRSAEEKLYRRAVKYGFFSLSEVEKEALRTALVASAKDVGITGKKGDEIADWIISKLRPKVVGGGGGSHYLKLGEESVPGEPGSLDTARRRRILKLAVIILRKGHVPEAAEWMMSDEIIWQKQAQGAYDWAMENQPDVLAGMTDEEVDGEVAEVLAYTALSFLLDGADENELAGDEAAEHVEERVIAAARHRWVKEDSSAINVAFVAAVSAHPEVGAGALSGPQAIGRTGDDVMTGYVAPQGMGGSDLDLSAERSVNPDEAAAAVPAGRPQSLKVASPNGEKRFEDFDSDTLVRMGEAYDKLIGNAPNMSHEERVDAQKYAQLVAGRMDIGQSGSATPIASVRTSPVAESESVSDSLSEALLDERGMRVGATSQRKDGVYTVEGVDSVAGLIEGSDDDDPVSKDVKKGEWNVIIRKSRPTRWDYYVRNPVGGGSGMSSFPSQRAAFAAATRRVDWGDKKRAWVIVEQWDAAAGDFKTTKTYWWDVPRGETVPVGPGKKGMSFSRGDVQIDTTLHKMFPEGVSASLGDALGDCVVEVRPAAAVGGVFAGVPGYWKGISNAVSVWKPVPHHEYRIERDQKRGWVVSYNGSEFPKKYARGPEAAAAAEADWSKRSKSESDEQTLDEAADWALVRSQGMDDVVVSTHKSKESAETAMRKAGGEPGTMFSRGMRVVNVGPDGTNEMIKIFGKRTIRPRTRKEDLGEAVRAGQFFVIIDKKTGKAVSEIYDSSAKADAALEKMGGERKTGRQVMDAMWHNPSRAKLRASGMGVEEDVNAAFGGALTECSCEDSAPIEEWGTAETVKVAKKLSTVLGGDKPFGIAPTDADKMLGLHGNRPDEVVGFHFKAKDKKILVVLAKSKRDEDNITIGTYETGASVPKSADNLDIMTTHSRDAEFLADFAREAASIEESRRALSVPDKHQLRVLTQTLRMPPAASGVMGGPDAEEAEEILRKKFGYTDAQIKKLKAESAVEAPRHGVRSVSDALLGAVSV